MFERFTEKARRTIFFARYEASQFGAPKIDTEHLLLGLLREDPRIRSWLPRLSYQAIRQNIELASQKRPKTPTSVDLPLTIEGKRVLKNAADEADRFAHTHIGTEHLLLGLFDEEDSFAAKLLRECGADAAELRRGLAEEERGGFAERGRLLAAPDMVHRGSYRSVSGEIMEIHGKRWHADYIRDCVKRAKTHNWHWRKSAWKPRDIVKHKESGRCSFDLTLASDSANFELVPAGWKKDECLICHWELFESPDDAAHGSGYTNGHDWLCSECNEKFWQRPDFFSSAYPEMT